MIGLWIVRCSESGAAVSLAHLVESEIAERKVVKCGKQLPYRNKGGALRMAGPTDRRCYWCDFPRERVEDVPEPTATEQDDSGVAPI